MNYSAVFGGMDGVIKRKGGFGETACLADVFLFASFYVNATRLLCAATHWAETNSAGENPAFKKNEEKGRELAGAAAPAVRGI